MSSQNSEANALGHYQGDRGLEVAKLIIMRGLACATDMRTFSVALNKAFLDWTRANVWVTAVQVNNMACISTEWSKQSTNVYDWVLRWSVMKTRPGTTFHAFHYQLPCEDPRRVVRGTHKMSVVTVTSAPLDVHSDVTFIRGGEFNKEATRDPGGHRYARCVCKAVEGKLLFRVEMKWE